MAGRPDKHNADYFSHDNNMRNDKKLKAVRVKFGNQGYAVYNMILESLSEANLIMIKNNELELEMLAGDFGITFEELKNMLEYFQKINLLKVTENLIFCPQLDSRLKGVFDKRNKDHPQLRENYCKVNGISVTEIAINSPEIHIVKESKVNKRKEKKEYTENSIEFQLSIFCENRILENFPNLKKYFTPKKIQDYCDCMNKLIRIDEKTEHQIKAAINFAIEDDFWKDNFQSALKLRRINKDGIKYVDVFLSKADISYTRELINLNLTKEDLE